MTYEKQRIRNEKEKEKGTSRKSERFASKSDQMSRDDDFSQTM